MDEMLRALMAAANAAGSGESGFMVFGRNAETGQFMFTRPDETDMQIIANLTGSDATPAAASPPPGAEAGPAPAIPEALDNMLRAAVQSYIEMWRSQTPGKNRLTKLSVFYRVVLAHRNMEFHEDDRPANFREMVERSKTRILYNLLRMADPYDRFAQNKQIDLFLVLAAGLLDEPLDPGATYEDVRTILILLYVLSSTFTTLVAFNPPNSEDDEEQCDECVRKLHEAVMRKFPNLDVLGFPQKLRKASPTAAAGSAGPAAAPAPSQAVCTICMATMDDAKSQIQLDCGHIFHAQCAVNWFRRAPQCPVCRAGPLGDVANRTVPPPGVPVEQFEQAVEFLNSLQAPRDA